jgi:hypothetical protein
MASNKLFDLAKAEIKKKDDEKAIEALQERVEDNKMGWMNDIHSAKRDVTAAKKALEAAQRNPNISASSFLNVKRDLQIAEANLSELEGAFDSRF